MADHPSSSAPSTDTILQTYHCLCTHLLLATTHSLPLLPRRAPPAIDSAIILPMPPPSLEPLQLDTDSEEEGSDVEGEPRPRRKEQKASPDAGYSLLLSTTQDRKPVVIRREDGFEKRVLLRCGRCRLVVGYRLDQSQLGGDGDAEKVVYLLPGGLVTTEEMKSGKMPEREERWAGGE